MLTTLIQQSQTLTELVSLCKMKDHLGINNNNSDDRIQDYLYTAQEILADETGLTFYTTTWQENYDRFPSVYWQTTRSPVNAITSLTYYDTSNTQQTLVQGTDFWATFPTNQAAIILPDESTGWRWYQVYDYRPDAVQLVYTAGGQVPYIAQQAVKFLVAYFNDGNRGTNDLEIPMGVERMFRLLRQGVYN